LTYFLNYVTDILTQSSLEAAIVVWTSVSSSGSYRLLTRKQKSAEKKTKIGNKGLAE